MATTTYDTLLKPDGSPWANLRVTIRFVENGTRGLDSNHRVLGDLVVYTDDTGRWEIDGPVVGPANSFYAVIVDDKMVRDIHFNAPANDNAAHWVGSLITNQ